MPEQGEINNSGQDLLTNEERLRSYFSVAAPGVDYNARFSAEELLMINRMLARSEERETEHRDQWGNWEFPFTKEDYQRPYLDEFVSAKLKSSGETRASHWPDGKKFAFWLTHDLDLVSEGDPKMLIRKQRKFLSHTRAAFEKLSFAAQLGYNYLRSLKKYTRDPLWCYERWMDMEQEFNFNSTFFVFTPPSDPAFNHFYDCDFTWTDKMSYRGKTMRVGDFINHIAEEGAEIACHGSYLSYNNPGLLKEQRASLIALTGKKILASRQHYLHFDISSTPSALESAGFCLDSTIGFNRTIGFRAGTAFPFLLTPRLLEVPQIVMDGALFNSNSLEYDEKMACEAVLGIMDQVETNGGCLTINFHPNYLLVPAWWNTYRFILKELASRKAACMNAELMLELYGKAGSFRPDVI